MEFFDDVTGARAMSKVTDEATWRQAAMMWAFTTLLQADRLREAVGDLNAAQAEQFFINRREAGTLPDGWKAHTEREVGDGMSWRVTWTAAADTYFFLSAAAQLRKCALELPSEGLPDVPDEEMIRLLRNFHEHWEDPTGPSATRLLQQVPDAEPGRVMYTKNDVWFEGVSLEGIENWAFAVQRVLRDNAAAAGEDLPDVGEGSSFPQSG
ncbi:hypothetical protein [Streptomyces endophyticus]|uniref:Uncharacterized protein n=1 Tax=Streptomyces endophyticus TaxID=714166 RepID=A0ABU6FGG9_9ACTN|nr:hypothetical protein [Streptomyces endophyticus]MEB8342568.1 hypothetical protein [Streptomyces endophyticus]